MTTMTRALAIASLVLITAIGARAQIDDRVTQLFAAMGFPELLQIMRQEGVAYGDELAGELFPAPPGASWTRAVDAIYGRERLEELIKAELQEALAGEDVAAMVAFFESPVGTRIIALELEARRAMLDPDIDTAARETWDAVKDEDTPRNSALRTFAEINSLVENNVVAALNSQFAFYAGLADGGAFDGAMSEQEILTDIWGQEEAIRESTIEWLFAYLTLAYQPLTDDELDAYIAFSETEAGQALNQALFAAFAEMFSNVNEALGAAAADAMQTREL
ncbi:MAG: DUF2059 domain-containing protein [Pseudomonadota bacterium]